MREQEMVERIVALSSKALAEKERDAFISCLQERTGLVAHILGSGINVREETSQDMARKRARGIGAPGRREAKGAERDGQPLYEKNGGTPILSEISFPSNAGFF